MEYVDLFEFFAQVFPFVGAQDAQGEADQGPEMDHVVVSAVVLGQFVDLGVAVVAGRDGVGGAGGLDLLVLQPAVGPAGVVASRLQEAAAAAAAEVVGLVGRHVDEVLLAHDGLDHVAQVVGHGVSEALTYQLAGVLNGEFDLEILVPVGAHREFSFPDPLRVVLDDALDFKLVLDVEFFQSGPDCK